MSDADAIIFNDFKAIEALANKAPRGADHMAIIKTLAAKYDRSIEDVRQIVLSHTIAGPC